MPPRVVNQNSVELTPGFGAWTAEAMLPAAPATWFSLDSTSSTLVMRVS